MTWSFNSWKMNCMGLTRRDTAPSVNPNFTFIIIFLILCCALFVIRICCLFTNQIETLQKQAKFLRGLNKNEKSKISVSIKPLRHTENLDKFVLILEDLNLHLEAEVFNPPCSFSLTPMVNNLCKYECCVNNIHKIIQNMMFS